MFFVSVVLCSDIRRLLMETMPEHPVIKDWQAKDDAFDLACEKFSVAV